jgi:hypothetical protein
MNKQPTFSHMSHGLGEHATGRPGTNHKGDITRMAPKKVTPVNYHPAMSTQTKSGGEALGGDHKSAVDSLSGLVIVPGKHGAEATAHPLVAPPLAKPHLGKPVAPVPGMRSRTNQDCETYADKQRHGADMLDCAVKN